MYKSIAVKHIGFGNLKFLNADEFGLGAFPLYASKATDKIQISITAEDDTICKKTGANETCKTIKL